MSNWCVSSILKFRAKKQGSRADVEAEAEKISMELCLYAQQKYPDYIFSTQAASIMQPLSEQVKA